MVTYGNLVLTLVPKLKIHGAKYISDAVFMGGWEVMLNNNFGENINTHYIWNNLVHIYK